MKIDIQKEKYLVQMLPSLYASTSKSLEKGLLSEDAKMYADIFSYFVYLVIRCTCIEEAKDIVRRLELYSNDLEKTDDMFLPWFFYILQTELQFGFEIDISPGTKVTYDAFEKNFSKNLEKYLPKG